METQTERAVTDWPYPAAHDESRWHEISEEHYYYFLEVLPPKRMFSGGFFVGEPARHTSRGIPVHACCLVREGRFWLREIPVTEDDLNRAADELAAQIRGER